MKKPTRWMMMKILDVLNSPWAIEPEKFKEVCTIYNRHLKGEKVDIASLEARAGKSFQRKEQGYIVEKGIAIVPVDGVISKKMNLFMDISGGASTQLIKRDIEMAIADEEVKAIILEIDSPGGTVDGTSELADFIASQRGQKPIISLADGCMCSAAYWIGSAADKIYLSSKTTQVGSIGVVSTHVDYSEANAQKGIKVTEIYSGKYKRINSEHEPLSKEGREYMQNNSDYLYSLFVDGVAANRGVTTKTVLDNMAEGKVYIGQQSIDVGLVDGFSTIDQLIESLSNNDKSNVQSLKAADKSPTQEEITMDNPTVESLEQDHPEVAQQLVTKGVTQERERIQAVQSQSMPGHESLVQEMMFDGKTTGPEAAVKILAAERANQAKVTTNVAADAEQLAKVPVTHSTENDTEANENKNLPFDARVKKRWESSAEIQAEFGGDFDAFKAYAEAQEAGNVRILGGK